MEGKVLYINHPESDYGGGFLYTGLCEVFGGENVFDYPQKLSYHGEVHRYGLPGIPHGETAPSPWQYPQPWAYADPGAPHEEIRERLTKGDFVLCVIESLRDVAVSNYMGLKDLIKEAGIPVVLHDGEDHCSLLLAQSGGKLDPSMFHVLLKRELIRGIHPSHSFDHEGLRVIGFPFSSPSTMIDQTLGDRSAIAKEHNVTLLCGRTDVLRQHVADVLRDRQDLDAKVAISPDDRNEGGVLLPWGLYMKQMAQSHIAVSVRGFGLDTARFWEAPLCTFMLADCPALLYEFPLEPGKHCVKYENASQCGQKAANLLEDKGRLQEIFEEGSRFIREHHTNKARILYLLEILRQMKLM